MTAAPLSVRLKTLRKSHHFTQQYVSEYLNISRAGYSHYETGKHIPDFHILERLANLYGITIDALLFSESFDTLPSSAEEEEPSADAINALSKENQKLLTLFSQLSPEEKDDFMNLMTVKVYQWRNRK